LLAVKRSLTVKQMIQVTVVSLITICIFLIIQFNYFVEERRSDYLSQIENIAYSIERPLSQDVWHMDYDSVQSILDSLNSMKILTEADVIIYSQYRSLNSRFPADTEVPDWFVTLFRLPITTTIPIYAPDYNHENQLPIARLVLKADSHLMYIFILKAACTLLFTFILLSLMLAIAISWRMNRLLISPLKTVAATLKSIPQGTTHQLAMPPHHEDDEIGMLVLNYNRNQMALEKAYHDLRKISTRDPLTDLPNRVLFEELLNQYITNSYRDQTEFSLLYINVNSMKETTSALGLPEADKLLSVIAQRLKLLVNSPNILARLGGDEFVALIPCNDQALQAMILAQKIIAQITKPIELDGLVQHMSANIGIAHYPNDGHSPLQLLRNAHSALTSSESQGNNNVLFFEPFLTQSIQNRLLLKNEINQGIQDNEFRLHLQPQIDMRNERVIGVEALVRWYKPNEGIRLPNDFIPLAEESGLIIPLGEKILELSFQYLADWQARNINIPISVNLAAAQIESPDFLTIMKRLMAQYRINPQRLKLEVTETGRIEDMDQAMMLLQSLQSKGFAIVLDDFGIGYSNLNYLRLLDIDTIKIDKSFVQNDQPNDKALVKIVEAIAKVFNVTVIAEGVETEEQKQWLLDHDIYYAQGYLYDPALDKETFEQRYLLNNRSNPRD
jgi:diguanylate cyclase (GGDEF)-like protein